MKVKTLILGLIAAVSFVVHAGEKLLKSGDTLVFMGDSITKFGNDHVYGYLHLVVNGLAANGINVNYLGKGISGQTAVQMKNRFQSDVINNHPQVVTIFGGVNDCGSNWPTNTSSTPDDIAAMADMAIEAGIKPVLLSPTGVNGENFRQNVCDYAAAVKNIAEARNVPYAATYEAYRAYIDDPTTPKISGQYKISADGTHMSLIGDRLLAREVLKALGLDATEIARAEVAWNAIPAVSYFHPSVKVTEGEYKAVKVAAARAGKPLNEYLKDLALQGCEQVSQAPATVAATSGASVNLSVTTPVTYVQYDQMIACGRAQTNHDAVPTVVNYAMLSAVHALPAVTDADLPTEPVQTVNASAFAKSIELTCSGYTGSSTLQDFPVAVRLAAGTPAGFSYADMKNSAKGDELRFADSTGRSLSYEIETWDPAGTSLVWVKIPSLAKNTKFTMYYGGTVSGAVQSDWTWRAGDYVGVWHMADASGKVSDSVNGLIAEPRGANASKFQAADAGVFGKGRVNSSNSGTYQGQSMLYVEDSTILDLGSDFTFSGWVKMTALSANSLGRIVSRNRGGDYGPDWELRLSDYTTLNGFAGSNTAVSGTIPSAQNTWVYIAGVFNGTTLTTYANGVKVFEQTIAAVADSDNKLVFGAKDESCVDGHFVGLFDEFRLRDAVSSADWIKAEYDQSKATFLTVGDAPAVEPGEGGEGEPGAGGDSGEVAPGGDEGGSETPPPAVDPSDATVASGDTTGATDTQTIQSLINASAAGGTVTLSSGTFYLNAQLTVANGVKLVGQGWTKTVLVQKGSSRCVTLDGGATLEGVTLTGANAADIGAGALVKNGTISWCCISNNTSTAANAGAAVSFTDGQGTIDHSIVANNTLNAAGWGAGVGGKSTTGAVVLDTCLIYGNVNGGGSSGGVGFDSVTQPVTIRSCTITANVCNRYNNGGVYIYNCSAKTGISMVNTIVAGNLLNGSENNLKVHSSHKVNFKNCFFGLAAEVSGCTSSASGTVPFVGNGDYRLSEAKEMGYADATGTCRDLDKNVRSGDLDVGCYEFGAAAGGEEGGEEPPPTLDPIVLAEPTARPQTDYNGSLVSVDFTGDIPEGAETMAKITIDGKDYAGTVNVEAATVSFNVPSSAVSAGNTYDAKVTLTVGEETFTKDVTLVQGTVKVDENTGWVHESATSFKSTGSWTGDKAEVANSKISVSNATFTAATAARASSVVTIASTLVFGDACEESFDTSKRAGITVVKANGVNRYSVLTKNGAVTVSSVVAKLDTPVRVTLTLDTVANTVAYAVDGVSLGSYAMSEKSAAVSKVSYVGATDVTALDGSYRFEGLDANLAKAGGVEYATVAEAIAANKGQVELLWDASWNPTAAGDYNLAKNGYLLAIGGALAYQVKDNGNGTVTVSVTGGETSNVPEATEITFEGNQVKVGVSNAKPGLWYALEKTTDLTKPFAIDASTWTSGDDIIAGDKDLVVQLGGTDKQAFYRVVVSTTAP